MSYACLQTWYEHDARLGPPAHVGAYERQPLDHSSSYTWNLDPRHKKPKKAALAHPMSKFLCKSHSAAEATSTRGSNHLLSRQTLPKRIAPCLYMSLLHGETTESASPARRAAGALACPSRITQIDARLMFDLNFPEPGIQADLVFWCILCLLLACAQSQGFSQLQIIFSHSGARFAEQVQPGGVYFSLFF